MKNCKLIQVHRFLLLLLMVQYACNKKFDEPPVYKGPDIQPTLSIRDLRSKHTMGMFEYLQDEDVIEGIIVADDRTDNFYQSVVLQDSTGGIMIRLAGFGLYNEYPVGTKLAVKVKELWMGDYAGMIQLGSGMDRTVPTSPELVAIPVPLFSRYLVKKSLNNPVLPRHVRLEELDDSLQSCLVQIDQLEFAAGDTGTTYADAINKLPDNKVLKACTGGSVYLRTSGFARFASVKTPRGNGTVTAVYSVFRKDKQLLLRDTSDVQLTRLRCTGTGPKLLFSEGFETQRADTDLSMNGWKNIPETGGKLFTIRTALANTYAEIGAYASGKPSVVSWLILPVCNLANTANEQLSFQTKDDFDNGAVLQVMASSNYDGGGSPWKAKWVPLKANMAKGSVSGVGPAWVPSGPVSLSGFKGMVYIAFRYEGADLPGPNDNRTTRFQIDQIRIEAN